MVLCPGSQKSEGEAERLTREIPGISAKAERLTVELGKQEQVSNFTLLHWCEHRTARDERCTINPVSAGRNDSFWKAKVKYVLTVFPTNLYTAA